MNAKVIWIGALLAGPAMALAADNTQEQARRCMAEPDALQRLVCYDRLFAPGAAPAPQAPAAPPATAPAAAVAVAPVVPVVSQPDGVSGETFGSDQLRRAPSSAEQEAKPSTMTAAVKELRETRPNVFRITLDNGQVWQQMDMDTQFYLQSGDTVEISRGKLGGYRMARQNRGGSGWVRVNRVK